MDILIQGNKLEFELEKEDNVLQVVETIEGWLSENAEIIDEIKIDGDVLLPTQKDEMAKRLVTTTKTVEIKTSSQGDFALESLYELDNYIDRFIAELKNNNNDSLENKGQEDVAEGIQWIHDVLLNVCRILGVDSNTLFTNEMPLSDEISRCNILSIELDTYKFNPSVYIEILDTKLIPLLESLKSYLPKIVTKTVFKFSDPVNIQVDNVKEALEDVIKTIDSFMPIIPQIGTELQAGKELEAYIGIKNILGMMENLVFHLIKIEGLLEIKFANFLVDGMNVDELNKEFNELLIQLSESFLKKDIVLIGDILEYELMEKLENYRRIFEELIVLLEKKNYN